MCNSAMKINTLLLLTLGLGGCATSVVQPYAGALPAYQYSSFIIKDGKDPVDLRLPTRKAWDQADSFCVKQGLVSSTYADPETGSDYIFRCIHAGTQTGRTPFGDGEGVDGAPSH
jgi:hypothetical protein